MGKLFILIYGVICYTCFFATFLYAIAFVGGFDNIVPKAINTGESVPLTYAIIINALLLGLFGIQHTIMARPVFKDWWTKIIPEPIERSTFVLATCICFAALFIFWQPVNDTIIWQATNSTVITIIWALFASGFGIVLVSTFLINHFDLFGLQQVWFHFTGKEYQGAQFRKVLIYKLVRHPLMLGFIIAFWAIPTMTAGSLIFAIITTAYIFVGVKIEENDLIKAHGEDYLQYKKEVFGILPIPKFGKTSQAAKQSTASV